MKTPEQKIESKYRRIFDGTRRKPLEGISPETMKAFIDVYEIGRQDALQIRLQDSGEGERLYQRGYRAGIRVRLRDLASKLTVEHLQRLVQGVMNPTDEFEEHTPGDYLPVIEDGGDGTVTVRG